jgi:hypothetical protein
MDELKVLLQDIERLRNELNKLIAEKNSSLQDPEVVAASQKLNNIILKYTELIKRKTVTS